MPYIKNSVITGAKDSYEITGISIDMENKLISVVLRSISIDVNGVPKFSVSNIQLSDTNTLIVDPSWSASSNPPKPAGFVDGDPSTWGGLTYEQIPRIIDQSKQYFTILCSTDVFGTSLYSRLKTGLYTVLANAGFLPPASDGWSIV